jgi:hypothetical protein
VPNGGNGTLDNSQVEKIVSKQECANMVEWDRAGFPKGYRMLMFSAP